MREVAACAAHRGLAAIATKATTVVGWETTGMSTTAECESVRSALQRSAAVVEGVTVGVGIGRVRGAASYMCVFSDFGLERDNDP
jgi:hypothetical protein